MKSAKIFWGYLGWVDENPHLETGEILQAIQKFQQADVRDWRIIMQYVAKKLFSVGMVCLEEY